MTPHVFEVRMIVLKNKTEGDVGINVQVWVTYDSQSMAQVLKEHVCGFQELSFFFKAYLFSRTCVKQKR